MGYTLKLHRDVEKQLKHIPGKYRERLVQTMRSLSVDPRPNGCKRLIDTLYRVREGEYRVIYAIFDDQVVVVICKVSTRAEKTYKNLKILLDRAEREL